MLAHSNSLCTYIHLLQEAPKNYGKYQRLSGKNFFLSKGSLRMRGLAHELSTLHTPMTRKQQIALVLASKISAAKSCFWKQNGKIPEIKGQTNHKDTAIVKISTEF